MKRNVLLRMMGVLLAGTLLFGCGAKEEEENTRSRQREEKEEEEEEEERERVPGGEEESDPEEEEEAETDLVDVLLAYTDADEDNLFIYYENDFDGDGATEAFALIGEGVDAYADKPLVEGDIWFVNEEGCEWLASSVGMGISAEERSMTIGGREYVMFDEIFVTEAVTHAYYVLDGEVYEAPFSMVGNIGEDPEGDEDRFVIMDSSYDMMVEGAGEAPIGHTWKYYYFFYNPERDEICEYGGTDIDPDTAEYWCDFDIVGELLPAGAELDSIYCRGNCLIIMNYEYEEDGCTYYYHYNYDFMNETLVDDYRQASEEPQPGICLKALCPTLADYPEVPGPDGGVWYE